MKDDVEEKRIIEQLKKVEQIGLNLDVAKIKVIRGRKQVVFNLPMPPETEIISSMLDSEANYRLLSAMVHGHSWALQPLSFSKVGETREIFTNIQGKSVEKHLDYSHVGSLCMISITSLSHAILMKFKLFGWNARPMAIAIDKTT
jgi:hypothetical protein